MASAPASLRSTWCPRAAAPAKATELARRIATNAPLTNYALMHALSPRIVEQTG